MCYIRVGKLSCVRFGKSGMLCKVGNGGLLCTVGKGGLLCKV